MTISNRKLQEEVPACQLLIRTHFSGNSISLKLCHFQENTGIAPDSKTSCSTRFTTAHQDNNLFACGRNVERIFSGVQAQTFPCNRSRNDCCLVYHLFSMLMSRHRRRSRNTNDRILLAIFHCICFRQHIYDTMFLLRAEKSLERRLCSNIFR